ncbi:MAG: hypothetical protein JRH20_28030 [Deltaproteobacteria bacterium]|nr:hypothetical protein [Deltaproteobacteria bacterium]
MDQSHQRDLPSMDTPALGADTTVDMPPPCTQTLCGDECVDVKTSADHCGRCHYTCLVGDHCSEGFCCPAGETACDGVCRDLQTNAIYCGDCSTTCFQDQVCLTGLCCNVGQENCDGECVDTATDLRHCTGCGQACSKGEICSPIGCLSTGCKDASAEQTFSDNMRGCAGTVTYANRDTLCAKDFSPCSAKEWVDNRNGQAPNYNYWTNAKLRWAGYSSGNCATVFYGGGGCGEDPMRVCASKLDPLGNRCNWIDCGFLSRDPKEYFGGCLGNKTAGVLCCR